MRTAKARRFAWVAALAGIGACSSPLQPKGAGGECFVVADCQVPLVCVPAAGGTRRCSSDTSSIVSIEDAGAVDTGAADTGAPVGPSRDDDGGAD